MACIDIDVPEPLRSELHVLLPLEALKGFPALGNMLHGHAAGAFKRVRVILKEEMPILFKIKSGPVQHESVLAQRLFRAGLIAAEDERL